MLLNNDRINSIYKQKINSYILQLMSGWEEEVR